MKRILMTFLSIVLLLSVHIDGNSQTSWYHQWGILPDKTLNYFIGESSGERAFNSIAELSEYNRQRTSEEYSGTLFESQYVAGKLKEYGLSEINIERLGKTKSWRGMAGSLWEVSPGKDKIADLNDLPFMVAPGSPNTDLEAELVYIGEAFNGDLDKMELTDKVVLTSARAGSIMNMVLQKGVVGVISYYSPRPLENELMFPDPKGGGTRGGPSKIFGFNLPPREGVVLRDRLLRGEKIKVHAIIKFRTEELDMQVPTCIIPGTDPAAGEVIISAHLFEGYGNQGANDNISGAAAILETARVINKLITEGTVARPKRTIRFIWVPEYSGTIPWVIAHKDIMKKTLCNFNLDMVGLSLSKYKSSFILHRTTYGNASFMNDVLENYYRYVGETNQMNSVISGSKFFNRIVAPTGTDDPFYYQIMSSSGGSDHDVFNDWGVQVPGVLMITWPDPFYHTSQDRVDKCDPTQLKRVVFLTAISAYTVAAAAEDDALDIAGEVCGNATRRIGYQVSESFDMVNKCGADNLLSVLKRAIGNIRGVELGEEMTIRSILKITPGSERVKDLLESQAKSLKDMAQSQINNLVRIAEYRAADFGMPKLVVTESPNEKRYGTIIPSLITDVRDLGYDGYNEKVNKLTDEVKKKYPVIGLVDREEAARLINGRNSVMDIKYIIDAQNKGETSPDGLFNYLNQLKEAGIIKL
jgi:aminopeptidase YwaD